ncbi:TetR/AcrR family transcriptional regulator [Clostridium sp. JN-1]|uniref:TetR/AcrR family transcriptional regulator n=1 Tax=Clostridium sp. JN-1 TaxID=2483110 RepID=UPI000F0BD207|nr:TetR/AcrR family transcriptional regulator [Clostridium sp. JN-1]
MTKKGSNETREKILDTAEEIFFEKGFDGARVDEIAKKANVNKASIYYYFESKEKILESLLEKNKNDMLQRKNKVAKEKNLLDKSISQIMNEFFKSCDLFASMHDKKRFFSILLIETLKNSSDNLSFFKLINEMYKISIPVSKVDFADMEQDDKETILLKMFFFMTMPIISFLTIGEKWAEFNEINTNNLNTKFMDVLKEMYDTSINEYLAKNEN